MKKVGKIILIFCAANFILSYPIGIIHMVVMGIIRVPDYICIMTYGSVLLAATTGLFFIPYKEWYINILNWINNNNNEKTT